jgi:hypothetical protein
VGIYSVTVLGNVEECRTEAEVSRDGQLAAVVYEGSDGWHTEIISSQLTQPQSDFDAAVNTARETLSHYVNRLGTNPPHNLARGGLSLWLMMKDDGTAMGISLQNDAMS